MRAYKMVLVLAFSVGLVDCAAEDEGASVDVPGVVSPALGMGSTGSVAALDIKEVSPLTLSERAVSPVLDAVMALGQARCETLGCRVSVRAFGYEAKGESPSIDEVVESVRLSLRHEMPLSNEGASAWKLLEGDLARLEMGGLMEAASEQLGDEAMELGRASALYWPKHDVEVFASVYVLHAPQSRGFVVVQILDVD